MGIEYGITRARHSAHLIGETPVQVADASPATSQRRRGFLVQNEGETDIELFLLAATSPALVNDTGILIPANGFGEFEHAYSGPITLRAVAEEGSESGSGTAVTEVRVRVAEYFG